MGRGEGGARSLELLPTGDSFEDGLGLGAEGLGLSESALGSSGRDQGIDEANVIQGKRNR
jgi:hypothetical protein